MQELRWTRPSPGGPAPCPWGPAPGSAVCVAVKGSRPQARTPVSGSRKASPGRKTPGRAATYRAGHRDCWRRLIRSLATEGTSGGWGQDPRLRGLQWRPIEAGEHRGLSAGAQGRNTGRGLPWKGGAESSSCGVAAESPQPWLHHLTVSLPPTRVCTPGARPCHPPQHPCPPSASPAPLSPH